MGFQNLLTITFLPGKGIGELKSMGMITKWAMMSRRYFPAHYPPPATTILEM
jgi:hypothetical protein